METSVGAGGDIVNDVLEEFKVRDFLEYPEIEQFDLDKEPSVEDVPGILNVILENVSLEDEEYRSFNYILSKYSSNVLDMESLVGFGCILRDMVREFQVKDYENHVKDFLLIMTYLLDTNSFEIKPVDHFVAELEGMKRAGEFQELVFSIYTKFLKEEFSWDDILITMQPNVDEDHRTFDIVSIIDVLRSHGYSDGEIGETLTQVLEFPWTWTDFMEIFYEYQKYEEVFPGGVRGMLSIFKEQGIESYLTQVLISVQDGYLNEENIADYLIFGAGMKRAYGENIASLFFCNDTDHEGHEILSKLSEGNEVFSEYVNSLYEYVSEGKSNSEMDFRFKLYVRCLRHLDVDEMSRVLLKESEILCDFREEFYEYALERFWAFDLYVLFQRKIEKADDGDDTAVLESFDYEAIVKSYVLFYFLSGDDPRDKYFEFISISSEDLDYMKGIEEAMFKYFCEKMSTILVDDNISSPEMSRLHKILGLEVHWDLKWLSRERVEKRKEEIVEKLDFLLEYFEDDALYFDLLEGILEEVQNESSPRFADIAFKLYLIEKMGVEEMNKFIKMMEGGDKEILDYLIVSAHKGEPHFMMQNLVRMVVMWNSVSAIVENKHYLWLIVNGMNFLFSLHECLTTLRLVVEKCSSDSMAGKLKKMIELFEFAENLGRVIEFMRFVVEDFEKVVEGMCLLDDEVLKYHLGESNNGVRTGEDLEKLIKCVECYQRLDLFFESLNSEVEFDLFDFEDFLKGEDLAECVKIHEVLAEKIVQVRKLVKFMRSLETLRGMELNTEELPLMLSGENLTKALILGASLMVSMEIENLQDENLRRAFLPLEAMKALSENSEIQKTVEELRLRFEEILPRMNAVVLAAREESAGLMPIGGKIHTKVDPRVLEYMKGIFGLSNTPFHLIHRNMSLVLPAFPSAMELKIFVLMLSSFGLLDLDNLELQLSMAGRWENEEAAVVGASTLLATSIGKQYSEGAFSPEQAANIADTGARIMAHDAARNGVRHEGFPFDLEAAGGRTDILGRATVDDCKNYQLLGTLASHYRYESINTKIFNSIAEGKAGKTKDMFL